MDKLKGMFKNGLVDDELKIFIHSNKKLMYSSKLTTTRNSEASTRATKTARNFADFMQNPETNEA